MAQRSLATHESSRSSLEPTLATIRFRITANADAEYEGMRVRFSHGNLLSDLLLFQDGMFPMKQFDSVLAADVADSPVWC
jgi:hypothetical protein